ncbi:MAG: PAM68 family protein [Cyanobacteria bacterium P01_F01_bin.86]
MPADSERNRLPFEPSRKSKKQQKAKVTLPSDDAGKSAKASQSASRRSKRKRDDTAIPEVVSRRMLGRMVIFSGIPVSLGILVFFGGYIVITRHIAELPNVAVFLATLGCFGLSVVGLSYGALSSSWDEDATGSWLGAEQFRLNAGRMMDAWRQAREDRQKQQNS